MRKLTNHNNLPAPFVRAVENDDYDNKGTLSVTTLLKPPMVVHLEQKYKEEIIEDVMDRIYSAEGQGFHTLMERSAKDLPNCIAEKRYYTEVLGHKVSGQIDLYYNNTLNDYKNTSVFKIKKAKENGDEDWTAQLNMQAELMREAGEDPKALRIIALARDWRKGESRREAGYPQKVSAIPIVMWSREEVREFMELKVREHTAQVPRPCTDKEKWFTGDKVALMKKGNKRALRVAESENQCIEWMNWKGLEWDERQHYFEVRVGLYNRCAGYCSGKDFCEFGKHVDSEGVYKNER